MIRLAYIRPSVADMLFWGSHDDLAWLRDRFREFAKRPSEMTFEGLELPDTDEVSKVIIIPAATAWGMRRDGHIFRWELDADTADQFAELVDTLVNTSMPAHQYLDCLRGNQITVMVSWGEYPRDWSPKSQR